MVQFCLGKNHHLYLHKICSLGDHDRGSKYNCTMSMDSMSCGWVGWLLLVDKISVELTWIQGIEGNLSQNSPNQNRMELRRDSWKFPAKKGSETWSYNPPGFFRSAHFGAICGRVGSCLKYIWVVYLSNHLWWCGRKTRWNFEMVTVLVGGVLLLFIFLPHPTNWYL